MFKFSAILMGTFNLCDLIGPWYSIVLCVGFGFTTTSLTLGFGGAGLLVLVNQYPLLSWLFPHWAQKSISHRLQAHKPSGLVYAGPLYAPCSK